MKRKCCICGEQKDLSEFYKNKANKYSKDYRCKKCSAIRWQEYYYKNRVKKLVKRQVFYKPKPYKRSEHYELEEKGGYYTAENLQEQRFGKLIVIERAGKDEWHHALWLCQCDCGNKVIKRGNLLKGGFIESCSRGCGRRGKYIGQNNKNYGSHRSEKTKEKLSQRALESYQNGRIVWSKGLTAKTDERIRGGKNNGRWIDGRSFEVYPSEFNEQLKELIRFRDGYKCQKCGMPEVEETRKFSIHHIDYEKKNCKPNNLITLCRLCNVKVNTSKQKWTKYFNKKVKKIMDSSAIQLNFRFEKQNINKTLSKC